MEVTSHSHTVNLAQLDFTDLSRVKTKKEEEKRKEMYEFNVQIMGETTSSLD